MGYVTANLATGERVVHQGKLHWIIFLSAFLFVFLALLMFAGGGDAATAGTLFLLLGGALALGSAILLQTSEFAVTNRRVLCKTGLLSRKSLDLNLGKIESVQVDQGILGRLLDYGTIVVRGSGGTKEPFKNISDPLAFRAHVQEQIEQRSRAELPGGGVAAPQTAREERECPHCAEPILAKAKICRHCNRPVEPATI